MTFWAGSNARLGIEATGTTGKRNRGPVSFPCAMCGEEVSLDRWPKERQDVRCDNCREAMSGLLHDADERQLSEEFRRDRKRTASGKYEGLPQMSEEDREAIKEARSRAAAMGNGRVGNRRRGGRNGGGGGGGGGGQRRRRGGGGGGGGGGGQRREGRRQRGQQQQQQQAEGEKAEGGGRRRRRRRRRGRRGNGGEGGGGEGGGGAKSQQQAAPKKETAGAPA